MLGGGAYTGCGRAMLIQAVEEPCLKHVRYGATAVLVMALPRELGTACMSVVCLASNEHAQSFSNATIVSSDFLELSTCSLQRRRYLRTCSLPPPGLYSPKEDLGSEECDEWCNARRGVAMSLTRARCPHVYASSLILAICDARPSVASIHCSKSTSSGSLVCAFA